LVFADHVALPLKIALARVFTTFAQAGVDDQVTFMASGKLGFPDAALLAFALGADLVNVGREAMLSIGCVQAQKCHTGRCPVGVATQSPYLTAGLDPTLKSVRFANYVAALRHELLSLTRACGELHPALVSAQHLEILDGHFGATSVSDLFAYGATWGVPGPDGRAELRALMSDR
jgi:glutamate synthase domain-containing protein 2